MRRRRENTRRSSIGRRAAHASRTEARALGALVVSGNGVYLVGAPLTAEEADPQIERLRIQ